MINYEHKCNKCGKIKEFRLKECMKNVFDGKLPCDKEGCRGIYYRQPAAPSFKVNGYSEANGYSKQGE